MSLPHPDPQPSDAVLVTRARAGDDAALGALVRRHQGVARAVACSVLGHSTDADDVVQDAFVRAHRNLDLLADPARFAGWLSRIVFGVAIDRLRAARTERRLIAPGAPPADLPDGALGPHERVEREELAASVLAAVRALPDRYRVPLTLYHLDGVSIVRIAESLGVPAGTARSLVTRARSRLRQTLAPATVSDDVFAERAEPRFLHVLNGDSVRVTLERSDVPGTFAVWADVLHDGPVPPFDVGEARWREIRADYHSAEPDVGLSREESVRMAERWDAQLATAPEHDETVLWLEHDLFDQLLLIRHLAWFSEQRKPPVALGLICIGAWPGMPDFKGLGELGPAELASLLGTRQRVTQRQLALGRRAWRAFTGPDHLTVACPVQQMRLDDVATVALDRFADGGPSRRRAIVENAPPGHRIDANFYIADWSFVGRLRLLAAEPRPLIRLTEGRERWYEGGVAELTDDGRAVLAGRADAVRLRGIDTWWGGVHLVGSEAAWRWDTEREHIVSDG